MKIVAALLRPFQRKRVTLSLDELAQASAASQDAALNLVLGRSLGPYQLPAGQRIVLTTNHRTS